MSYMPQTPPGGFYAYPQNLAPQQRESNVPAIVALVLGVLGICPGVGVLAIVFGVWGTAKSMRPNTGGRALAVAGLVLGIVTTIAYGYVGYGVYSWKQNRGEAQAVAEKFVKDLLKEDVSGALASSDAGMAREDVVAAIDQLKAVKPEGENTEAEGDTTTPVEPGLDDEPVDKPAAATAAAAAAARPPGTPLGTMSFALAAPFAWGETGRDEWPVWVMVTLYNGAEQEITVNVARVGGRMKVTSVEVGISEDGEMGEEWDEEAEEEDDMELED